MFLSEGVCRLRGFLCRSRRAFRLRRMRKHRLLFPQAQIGCFRRPDLCADFQQIAVQLGNFCGFRLVFSDLFFDLRDSATAVIAARPLPCAQQLVCCGG